MYAAIQRSSVKHAPSGSTYQSEPQLREPIIRERELKHYPYLYHEFKLTITPVTSML